MARLGRGTGHGGVIEQGVEEGRFPDIGAAQECDLGGVISFRYHVMGNGH